MFFMLISVTIKPCRIVAGIERKYISRPAPRLAFRPLRSLTLRRSMPPAAQSLAPCACRGTHNLLLQTCLIDAHTRAHRARKTQFLEENSLRSRGLRSVDGIDQSLQILGQRFNRERGAADRALHDPGLIGAVLHLPR